MPEPVFEITKAASFDAAHSLPHGPRGEYRRLHGHSFRVEASLRGPRSTPIRAGCRTSAPWTTP